MNIFEAVKQLKKLGPDFIARRLDCKNYGVRVEPHGVYNQRCLRHYVRWKNGLWEHSSIGQGFNLSDMRSNKWVIEPFGKG